MSKMTVWDQLAYPFPERFVYWFNKGGIDLAYLDARTVMDRLDQVLGAENWMDKYEETASGRVLCTLTIAYMDGETRHVVSKCDGAGDTSIEGEKGGLSDAFKRAAVKFGIGRYLYRLAGPSPVKGRLPNWAVPGGPPIPDATTNFPGDTVAEEPADSVPGDDDATDKGGESGGEDSEGGGEASANVVNFEEAKAYAKMIEQFTALQERGIKKMGLEEYTKKVNFILDEGYGGVSWRDEGIDLNVAREMYKNIAKAIDNHQGGVS